MITMDIEYTGDLKCRAVHTDSGVSLTTAAPVDNQGDGSSFSPTDLVATGLATCMATIMGIVAKRHQFRIEGMRVCVTKEMTTDTPRRIKRLATEIRIPIPRSTDPNGLLERAANACPVHHSLHPDIEKPITFYWKEP